jgi:putative protein-disulfide isomerase
MLRACHVKRKRGTLCSRQATSNRDVRDPKELGRIAEAHGIAAAALEEALASPELHAAVAAEFRETAAIGIKGYPTLLAMAPEQVVVLSLGCRPYEDVAAALKAMLGDA